jgi:hypothetical protein
VSATAKMPLIDFALEPSRLPASWLGYSALRAVVIGGPEWMSLTEQQRTALRKWTACGGDLIVVDAAPGSSLAPGISLASPDGSRSTVPYFLGHLHRLRAADMELGMTGLLSALSAARAGSWRLPVNRAADWTLAATKGFRLRMAGIGDVHARGYLMLLLLFALLIGPLNYLYLQHRGLQPLLVLTAPLIAVAFLVLLAVYVVIGEGFGVHVRAATLTVLDQDRQEAVTRAEVSLYPAGRTPGGGLRFSDDTAVVAFASEDRSDVHLDLGDGQRFDRGLARARVPLNVETVEWRPARERLTFTRENGGLTVVNGLGATLTALFVRSPSGSFELAAPVIAGGRGALRRWTTQPLLMPVDHPLYGRFYEVMTGQPVSSYVALLDKATAWNPGVTNAIEHDSTHVVLGLMEQMP